MKKIMLIFLFLCSITLTSCTKSKVETYTCALEEAGFKNVITIKGDNVINSLNMISEIDLEKSEQDKVSMEKQMKEIENVWNGTDAFEINSQISDEIMKIEMTIIIENASDKMLEALLPQFDFKDEPLEIKNISPKEIVNYYESLGYVCK